MLTVAVPEADAARCSKRKRCPECLRCTKRRRCKKKKNGRAFRTGACRNGSCVAAPHQGICTAKLDYCTRDEASVQCGAPGESCECVVRANGLSFCAASTTFCTDEPCTSDLECVAKTGDVGAVCLGGANCNWPFLGVDTICKAPCPNPR